MAAIASRLEIEGTQPQIFHALLDWVETALDEQASLPEAESVPNSQLSPNTASPSEAIFATAVIHQAQTLAWLTSRLESLEQQLSQLQQERDEALSLAEQSSHLKEENQLLRQDNQTLLERAARFEAARQALLGEQLTLPITVLEPSKMTEPATTAPPVPSSPPTPSTRRRQRSEGKAVARAKKIVGAISLWN